MFRHLQQRIAIIAGSGIEGEQRWLVPSCTRVRVVGELCVQLEVGPASTHALSVRGDHNIAPHVTADVRSGVLEIALASGAYQPRCALIVNGTCAALAELEAVGGARVRVRGLDRDSVKLVASGASRLEVAGAARKWKLVSDGYAYLQLTAAEADEITIMARGASAVDIRGSARSLRVDARPATRVDTTHIKLLT